MKVILISFKEFIKKNIGLICFCISLGFFLYGIRIFSYSIGIDSDVYMQDPSKFVYEWNFKEGRFGLTLVQLLFFGDCDLNIYGQNIGAVCLLIFSCVLWCYILSSHCSNNKIGLYAFVTFYLSSVVWLEIIYFTFMALACTLGIALIPISLIIWEINYKTKSKKLFLLNCLLVAFIVSIYQLLITLFFAGGLILIKLYYEKDNNIKELKYKILNFVFLIVCSLLCYFIENKINCYIFNIKLDEYVTGQLFSASSINNYLKNICFLVYSVLIGDTFIPTLADNYLHIVKPENKGMFELYSYRGNLTVFVAFILYSINVIKEYISSLNFYFLLVNLGIIISIFIVGIVGSGNAPDRYLQALPLVSAFFIFCSFKNFKYNGFQILWSIFCFFYLIHQCSGISFLNNSDIKRYENEYAFCNTLYSEIKHEYYKKNSNASSIPTVLVLGEAKILDDKNSTKTAIIGQSATMFGSNNSKIEATLRIVPFMNALGYKVKGIKDNDERLDDLRIKAQAMPIYPNKGSIKIEDNVVIVKLS